MTLILIVLLLVIIFGGGGLWYNNGAFAGQGFSLVGLLLIVLLVLYLTGNLHRI